MTSSPDPADRLGDPPADPSLRELSEEVHRALQDRGLSVAAAESLTGGGLADQLSGPPGASATFRGGVVAYTAEVKRDVLGVRAETLRAEGAVSPQTAAQLCVGVRSLLQADWGVATTGVAGPDAQEGHPPGLVFVGLAGPDDQPSVHELRLLGDRDQVRRAACEAALSALLAAVLGIPG